MKNAGKRDCRETRVSRRLLKAAVFLICLAPAVMLVYRTFVSGDLGVNPVETLQHETGRPALQLLLATLAITPIRRLTGWNGLIRLRRMLGLFACAYGLAHFAIYFIFDQVFSVAGVFDDTTKRRFILSGMVALLAMLRESKVIRVVTSSQAPPARLISVSKTFCIRIFVE